MRARIGAVATFTAAMVTTGCHVGYGVHERALPPETRVVSDELVGLELSSRLDGEHVRLEVTQVRRETTETVARVERTATLGLHGEPLVQRYDPITKKLVSQDGAPLPITSAWTSERGGFRATYALRDFAFPMLRHFLKRNGAVAGVAGYVFSWLGFGVPLGIDLVATSVPAVVALVETLIGVGAVATDFFALFGCATADALVYAGAGAGDLTAGGVSGVGALAVSSIAAIDPTPTSTRAETTRRTRGSVQVEVRAIAGPNVVFEEEHVLDGTGAIRLPIGLVALRSLEQGVEELTVTVTVSGSSAATRLDVDCLVAVAGARLSAEEPTRARIRWAELLRRCPPGATAVRNAVARACGSVELVASDLGREVDALRATCDPATPDAARRLATLLTSPPAPLSPPSTPEAKRLLLKAARVILQAGRLEEAARLYARVDEPGATRRLDLIAEARTNRALERLLDAERHLDGACLVRSRVEAGRLLDQAESLCRTLPVSLGPEGRGLAEAVARGIEAERVR